MTRGLALFTALGLVGCTGADEDETSTSSPTTSPTTTPSTTATSSAGTDDSADETHGRLTEQDTTGDECEMFEFTEVDGCENPIGEQFCSEGAAHHPLETELDGEWMNNPPHSGPHWPMWANWGEHDETLEREFWVHNLEHGGIVFAYRCAGDCDADVQILRDVMTMRPDLRILITPDPDLPADGFAAISWTWVHTFATPDLDELLCFVDQHENHAPEDVP